MRESVRVLGTGAVAVTLTTGVLLAGAVELAFGPPDIGGTITDAGESVVDATVAATGWF